MRDIYFEDWGPGWVSLTFTAIFGVFLIRQAYLLNKARESSRLRILVTGSRGKSGTVRLLHNLMIGSDIRTYSKITGTTAVELFPDGSEKPTVRYGSAGIPEMKMAMRRSLKLGVTSIVFESMAVTPKLIELVDRIVKPHIGVIPAITLDHTEEEGLNELEIATNIIYSIRNCREIFVFEKRPEIKDAYKQMSEEFGFNLHFVEKHPDQPEVAGHHPTNVAMTIAIGEFLGLPWEKVCEQCSLEPEANIFHRIELPDQTLDLFDISGANDPESAKNAFAGLPIEKDRVVIPIVVNRWERPQRGVIFSEVFREYEPFVLRCGPRKRGNNNIATQQENFLMLEPQHLLSIETLARLINEKINTEEKQNVALVLFANVHQASADRIRKIFENKGETLKQVQAN